MFTFMTDVEIQAAFAVAVVVARAVGFVIGWCYTLLTVGKFYQIRLQKFMQGLDK